MINQKILLNETFPMLKSPIELTSYVPDNTKEVDLNRNRPCIVVLPGGGYGFLSDREGEPIALRFLAQDMAAFVLKYAINENICYPEPMCDVYAAIAYIRQHAKEYHINPNAIGVIGFSAGGHLAAITSAFHRVKEYSDFLKVDLEDIRINATILGYPVICREYGHKETMERFSLGSEKAFSIFSVDEQVTEAYPPTFVYHTSEDTVVPVQNALYLCNALACKNVPFELHVYPKGVHGTSLCDESVYSSAYSKEFLEDIEPNTRWIQDCIRFVKTYTK